MNQHNSALLEPVKERTIANLKCLSECSDEELARRARYANKMAEETARATRRTPKAVIPERFAQGRRDGFAAGYPAGHTEGLEGLELDWSAPACDRAISGHYDDGFAIGFSEGFLNGHRRGTALR